MTIKRVNHEETIAVLNALSEYLNRTIPRSKPSRYLEILPTEVVDAIKNVNSSAAEHCRRVEKVYSK